MLRGQPADAQNHQCPWNEHGYSKCCVKRTAVLDSSAPSRIHMRKPIKTNANGWKLLRREHSLFSPGTGAWPTGIDICVFRLVVLGVGMCMPEGARLARTPLSLKGRFENGL